MTVLSDMSNDDLEQIYYSACREFPNMKGLRAVADAAIAADRAQGAEPFGFVLYDHHWGSEDFVRGKLDGTLTGYVHVVPVYTRPQPVVVPEGWKLVPVRPTTEMSFAGEHERRSHIGNINPVTTWAAMLAAAPASQEPTA